jgi:hypothetical protein
MALIETPRFRRSPEWDEVCWYCGVPLSWPVANKPHKSSTRTVDHVFALALGGTNHESNRVNCCNRCNHWKADKTLEVFRSEARPGVGKDALFFAEIREAELTLSGDWRDSWKSECVNETMALKMTAALGK